MSQAKPTRGWNSFFALGSVPSEGKRGSLRETPYAVCAGGTTGEGNICPSQRRPYVPVKFGRIFQESCAKSARSSLAMSEKPAASVAGPVSPAPCRKRRSGAPGAVAPAGQGVGAVTKVPLEQPVVFGPKPPGAAGEA